MLKSHFAFVNSKYALVLTLVLVLQGAIFYSISGGDAVPLKVPLSAFPAQIGGWKLAQEGVIEKEIQEVLRADDTLQRVYAEGGQDATAGLFIAYFETQRTGRSPHSPRNCLAGAGWNRRFQTSSRSQFPENPSRSRSTGTSSQKETKKASFCTGIRLPSGSSPANTRRNCFWSPMPFATVGPTLPWSAWSFPSAGANSALQPKWG